MKYHNLVVLVQSQDQNNQLNQLQLPHLLSRPSNGSSTTDAAGSIGAAALGAFAFPATGYAISIGTAPASYATGFLSRS